jgi:D-glycero-D-manno-heptose 1,7-bisphosphate phosphatase
MNRRRAVFIDRDGVVVRSVVRMGFELPTAPFSFEELVFEDGVAKAIRLLRDWGFLCILISNQPDVAYGHMARSEWRRIQNKVEELDFDDIFLCRHTRDAGCECRKPKPGMLLKAAARWNIDLARSYMVGDTAKDTLAGKAAGCKTVLISTSYNKDVESDLSATSLHGAALLIIEMNKEVRG